MNTASTFSIQQIIFKDYTVRFMLILLFLSLSMACTKKRPEINSQGQIKDLIPIRDVDGKTFQLKTYDKEFERADNTKAEDLQIDKDFEDLNNYGYVRYTTNAELLGNDIPFRGKTNSEYEVKYSIRSDEKLLVVLKLGSKKLIPHDEHPFAVAGVSTAGILAVPLVGYRILGFYRIEKMRNSDNEKTNVNVEIPESDFSKATHMRIDRLDRQAFEAIKMSDVYPASYFTQGDWYYSQTVVGATVEGVDSIGDSFRGFDSNMSMATRIHFKETKSYLLGVNLNIDTRLAGDELNYPKVIQIPVEWIDNNLMNHIHAKVLRPQDRDKVWSAKPLIKINFENSVSTSDVAIDQTFLDLKEEKKLVMLQFSKDNFSFTLYDPRRQERVKHSFLRINNRNYTAKSYPEEDLERFGFFSGDRARVFNHQLYRREDIFKNRFLARFNTRNKEREIVYHLTTSSPNEPWLLKIADAAVSAWSKAFKEAGVDIRIRLEPNKRVELGDIRYNTINFIKAVTADGLNGFGPMLIDPFSGEIISATSNIHLTSLLSMMTDSLRDYIRFQMGELDGPTQTIQMQMPPFKIQMAKKSDEIALSRFNFQMPIFYRNHDDKPEVLMSPLKPLGFKAPSEIEDWFNSEKAKKMRQVVEHLDKQGQIQSAEDFYKRHQTLDSQAHAYNPRFEVEDQRSLISVHLKKIDSQCPEVSAYITKLKATQSKNGSFRQDTEVENAIIEPCVQKLAAEPILSVLVHEMGHNFGLRHNFIGSADAANFLSREDIQRIYGIELNPDEIPKSSSVMDYVSSDHDRLTFPGLYDIAAIRYGYADKVELRNGETETIQTNETLKQVAHRKGGLKDYMYCDDTAATIGIDPMCARHDYGVTPSEVIDNMIQEYYDNFILRMYRFDRIHRYSGDVYARFIHKTVFMRLRRFYDRWRLFLREKMPGKDYLEGYTTQNYLVFLNREFPKEKATKSRIDEYFAVREKIFNFLTDVAFMPNRYCVTEKPSGEVKFLELERIRQMLSQNGINTFIFSCQNEDVQAYLKTQNLKYHKEIGHPLDDLRFSLLDKHEIAPLDIVGMYFERLLAIHALTGRAATSILNLNREFFPSPIDEPDLQDRLVNLFLERLIDGVNVTKYMSDLTGSQRVIIPTFRSEKLLLTNQFALLKQSAMMLNKKISSEDRYGRFRAFLTQLPSQAEEFRPSMITTPGGGFIGARPEWYTTVAMIDKLQTLNENFLPVNNDISMTAMQRVIDEYKKTIPEGKIYTTIGEIEETIETFTAIMNKAKEANTLTEDEMEWIQQGVIYLDLDLLKNMGLSFIKKNIESAEDPLLRAQYQNQLKQLRKLDATAAYAQVENKPLSATSIQNRFEKVKAEFTARGRLTPEELDEMRAQSDALFTIIQDQPLGSN